MFRILRVIFILTFICQSVFAQAQVVAVPISNEVEKAPLFLSWEQRVLLSYALIAQGADDEKKFEVINRLNEFKNKNLKKGFQTISVENFEQFLNLYRGEWPNTNSLELDLQIIESTEARGLSHYVAKSPRIQKKIDQFLKNKTDEIIRLVRENQSSLSAFEAANIGKAFEFSKELLSTPSRAESEKLPLKLAKQLLDYSERLLTAQVQELDRIGTKISQSDLGSDSDMSTKILLQTVFGEYFSRLSADSKKIIVSAYLGGNLNCNDLEKFEIMVQNSGPQLQKVLQVVARQSDMNPSMLAIFKKLESSVKQVPWVQVEEILNREKGNYDFIYFERKPLGIGTMAQVHRAKIMVNGERRDVVVRFMKPGIADRVQEDHRILVKVAEILDANPEFKKTGMPQMGPMVNDITATVSAELSQPKTIKRQVIGAKAYNKIVPLRTATYKGDLKFNVPAIFPAKDSKSSELMVQEMVLGRKLDKEVTPFEKIMPDLKLVIVEQVARMWLEEVLFGSGFYHADLHQGNFMVQVGEPTTQVNILDFGMGGVLSEELQSRVIVLGAGVDSANGRLIAQSFWAISDKNKNRVSEDEFTKLVSAKMQSLRQSHEILSMDMWTAWATDQGIRLPYDFINLNRGFVIVTKLLQDAGSHETMMTLTQSLVIHNPLKTYRSFSQKGKMSIFEIAKLGWSQSSTQAVAAPLQISEKTSGVLRCEAVFH